MTDTIDKLLAEEGFEEIFYTKPATISQVFYLAFTRYNPEFTRHNLRIYIKEGEEGIDYAVVANPSDQLPDDVNDSIRKRLAWSAHFDAQPGRAGLRSLEAEVKRACRKARREMRTDKGLTKLIKQYSPVGYEAPYTNQLAEKSLSISGALFGAYFMGQFAPFKYLEGHLLLSVFMNLAAAAMGAGYFWAIGNSVGTGIDAVSNRIQENPSVIQIEEKMDGMGYKIRTEFSNIVNNSPIGERVHIAPPQSAELKRLYEKPDASENPSQ